MLRKLKVLGVGLILGAVFALLVAGPMMPAGMRLSDRALIWASVMSGPIIGTVWGWAEFNLYIKLGWFGLLLIPAHPLRPNIGTACVTVLGLLFWFFAGFLAVMEAVWGA
jgi:hypothetical protein